MRSYRSFPWFNCIVSNDITPNLLHVVFCLLLPIRRIRIGMLEGWQWFLALNAGSNGIFVETDGQSDFEVGFVSLQGSCCLQGLLALLACWEVGKKA